MAKELTVRIGMILSTPLPPREGIGFYAWNLALYLVEQGHTVHLVTRGSPVPSHLSEIEGIQIWRLPYVAFYPFHVHFHGIFINRWLKKMEGELDLLHLHSPLVPPPQSRLPVLVTVHTPLKADTRYISTRNIIGFLVKLQAPFSFLVEESLFCRADRITATSSSVSYELAEYGISPTSVTLLGNGVDSHIFNPSVHIGRAKTPYIFSACRLAPRKGLEDLVLAAENVVQIYPKIRFFIAGSGPLEFEIKRLIRSKGLEGVIYLIGHIRDRQEMVSLYQNASIFVHPARYEGLPTVVLEAMACGCAVVSTAVSGALDVIQSGVNGLLIPPGNPRALADGILAVLKDPALASRMGEAAWQTVQHRYSWQVVGANYLSEYVNLLQSREPRGG